MSFHSTGRPAARRQARRLESYRPEVQVLEDRVPPGQLGLGTATWSVFGAGVAALEADTDGAAPVDLQPAAATTGSLSLTDTAAVPVQVTLTDTVQAPSQTTSTSTTDTGTPAATGTTGLSQNEGLAGLAAGMKHRILPVRTSNTTGNQQAVGIGGGAIAPGGGAIVPNTTLGTGTVDNSGAGQLPANYAAALTAPSVLGGSDTGGRGTAPPVEGPLATVVGSNNLGNQHTSCSSTTGLIQSETSLAQSGNTVVMGYNDFRGFYCSSQGFQVNGWAYSTDRGNTWTDGHSLPGTTQWRGDPWLATGPDGTIYMAGLYGNPNLTSVGVLRGTVDPNTGLVSWAGPTLVNLGSPDKEAMVVDQNSGTIYISYTSFSGAQSIKLIKSTDGGLTFSSPVTVYGGSPGGQGSQVAVGPNGEVYVCWDLGYPSDSGIGFAYSLDGGTSFTVFNKIENTVPFTVTGTDRAPAFPHMAVDLSGGPYTGNIYITWQSNFGGKGNALMVTSSDGGNTWSSPNIIDFDNTTTGIDWYPTVSVDSNGFVHSFFYDRRDNPGTTITNLYYARSTDGGQTFEPNVLVTSTPTSFKTFNEGSPAWGDYINSIAVGPSAAVAYTDGRLGDPDAFFTRVGSR